MANPITARGVIAYKPGEPGVVEEFLVPHPGPGEALVRILASGVCHTDLSAKNGVFGTDYFPFLLGHEGAASSRKSARASRMLQRATSSSSPGARPAGSAGSVSSASHTSAPRA